MVGKITLSWVVIAHTVSVLNVVFRSVIAVVLSLERPHSIMDRLVVLLRLPLDHVDEMANCALLTPVVDVLINSEGRGLRHAGTDTSIAKTLTVFSPKCL